MANHYYSFDFTEMKGSEAVSMGILAINTEKSISREQLKILVKQHLQNSTGEIFISNVMRISKAEFESFNMNNKQTI